MKVIFLDIDGVIATDDGKTDFDRLQSSAIRKLNRLIDDTHAQIVISSTWRKYYSLLQLIKMLRLKGFNHSRNIIGSTPVLKGFNNGTYIERGEEIAKWLELTPVEQYVILDDDIVLNHDDHFVQVIDGWKTGIQDEHIETAKKILGVRQ